MLVINQEPEPLPVSDGEECLDIQPTKSNTDGPLRRIQSVPIIPDTQQLPSLKYRAIMQTALGLHCQVHFQNIIQLLGHTGMLSNYFVHLWYNGSKQGCCKEEEDATEQLWKNLTPSQTRMSFSNAGKNNPLSVGRSRYIACRQESHVLKPSDSN